jgi:hypothetical protein
VPASLGLAPRGGAVTTRRPPHGLDEIRAFYGDVKIEKRGGRWEIIQPITWEAVNCVLLRDLPGLGSKSLYVHRLIAEPLRRALARAAEACPDYAIRTIGCFNPRPKKASDSRYGVCGWDRGLSLHTVAAAVDINHDRNPWNKALISDMPSAFVRAFDAEGFTWGGDFTRMKDPMHFQYGSGY